MTETSARPANWAWLPSRLARARAATQGAMLVERLWPLVLPFLVVVSLFLSLSWLGAFRLMPELARLVILGLLALAALASLSLLSRFRWPGRAAIDRRIEQANRLEHAPVGTQTDRLAGDGSPFAAALWREHQKRMAARLSNLSGDLPATRVPERDPWALRAAAALLLAVAFAFSLGPDGGRVTDAFRAGGGRPAVPPRIDAWVTPPAYTGKAPLFLTADANRETGNFTVPEGSEVAVRVTGGSGGETLSFTDAGGSVAPIAARGPQTEAAGNEAADRAARQFAHKLTGNGTLSLGGSGADRQWAFTVIPDKPPVIRFAGEPKRAANGTLELAYEVKDDYGAAKAQGEFALADKPAADAHPLYAAPELPLTLPPRGEKRTGAKTSRDLTKHPWAGGKVTLTLAATDDAGHTGRSEPKSFILPERPFSNPLARALIEDRRMLALDANAKPRVMALLDAVTLWPEETIASMAHFLAISSARTRLDLATSDDQLRGVADYLWDIALNIENGDLTDAEKRLKQAQQALKDALKNGASDEEIDKLMNELRQAMNEYLREFAERAMQNPDMAQQMPENGQSMSKRDIDKMLDQIEELAKSGSKDQAQQLLSQLENMMNNLQAGRQQQGQGNREQSQMRQQMDKLGEIMRRQQQMMNETFGLGQQRQGQRQRGEQRGEQQGQMGQQGQGEQGEQGRQQGQQGQGGMSPQEFADAMKRLQQGQGQLRGDLQGMMKGLKGLGIQPGEGFGEAGQAMGEAEGALGKQDGDEAVGEQGRALDALRKGAQNMMQQMQQQAQRGEGGGSEQGGRQQDADRDPLGRPRASNGPDFGDSVKVPDEIDIQRARRILEAIRKRLGNALSPELEKSYLERLLNME